MWGAETIGYFRSETESRRSTISHDRNSLPNFAAPTMRGILTLMYCQYRASRLVLSVPLLVALVLTDVFPTLLDSPNARDALAL